MQVQQSNNRQWSSRFAFLLAAVGSAVGLGNFWRFPYQAGENGGGSFVVTYLLCVLFIGIPVLIAELFIGRRGQRYAIGSVSNISKETGAGKFWLSQAWLGMLGSFLILTFYSVIAGWLVAYSVIFAKDIIINIKINGISGLIGGAFSGQDEGQIRGHLNNLLSDYKSMIFYHFIFAALTASIVARGIKKGIEGAITILMPTFFVLFLFVIIYAASIGDFTKAVDYLFSIRLNDLAIGFADGSIISAAMGQAFFSIGLGSALMLTYGSYLNKKVSITNSSFIIAGADSLVAILAGMAIFPLVFAYGMEPNGGPTLLFQSLPVAFSQMPFGSLIGLLFFLLAIFAALSSSIALLETVVAMGDEKNSKIKRVPLTIIVTILFFVIGIGNVLSQVPLDIGDTFFNHWVPLDFYLFKGNTMLDLFDTLTGQVILPLAGLITAIYAGWIVDKKISFEELGVSQRKYNVWRFLIRYVCPVCVMLVLLYSFLAPFFQS